MISRLLVLGALTMLTSVARGDAAGFTLRGDVPAGDKPSVTVSARQALDGVELSVTREDGASFSAKRGPLAKGKSTPLVFGDGKAGRAKWTGKLVLRLPGGKQESFDLTFETKTIGELRITYDREHLDLDGRKLEIQLSRPAGHASLVAFGEDGAELGRGEAKWSGQSAGQWLPISWTQKAGTVARLEVRVTSADDLTTLLKLVPWSVSVPHDEVNFASGESQILPAEEPKLDASYKKIIDAIAVARKADPSLSPRLFIIGHTDTVGSMQDNLRLSIFRAKSIAKWFFDRGLPLPIHAAGAGEQSPRVKTADEVDEPRNRRVDYIVAFEEPTIVKGQTNGWIVFGR